MGRSFEVRKVAMAKTAAAKTKVYSNTAKKLASAPKMAVQIKRKPLVKTLN